MVWYQQSTNQLQLQEKQLQPLTTFSPTLSLTVFKTVIFKTDISDHFSICFLCQNSLPKQNNKGSMFLYKRTCNTESIELFKQKLHEIWYTFPWKNIKLKSKDLQSPWRTKGIRRSSKRKQRLYQKFLKNRNETNELEYKIINIFLKQSKNAPKNYSFLN